MSYLVAVVLCAVVFWPDPALGADRYPEPRPAPNECNLCALPPETINALIEACLEQPDGMACQVLATLVGIPAPAKDNG